MVERIELDGAGQEGSRLGSLPECDQAFGDDTEVFRSEIGLGQQMFEVKLCLVGATEAEKGDRLEAVKDGRGLFVG